MSRVDNKIFNYSEILEEIENQVNHLLIGNGFNYGLGINTGYRQIFNKMIENNRGIYKDAEKLFIECGFDLEEFIGKLEGDIHSENLFLRKFVKNEIKLDFMQATHEIVKSSIKNIYAEKNEGVFILLKNFTNYFSLNYDSFLYLLLLKYKPISGNESDTIVLQPSLGFIEEDMNDRENTIYQEIKEARNKGEVEINFGDESTLIKKKCSNLTKSHFLTEVKEYNKTNAKGWKSKHIDKVVKRIIEEEKRTSFIKNVNDGAGQPNMFGDIVFDPKSDTQNVFFLHGAFHIYRDGESIKKITQQTDKALYDKLEEILNSEDKDIVCVFQNKDKITSIKENKYLNNCLMKLGEISGNLVIIGSSLSNNDDHIFDQINNSHISKIYLSTLLEEEQRTRDLANIKFPEKEVFFFDARTISYEFSGAEEVNEN